MTDEHIRKWNFGGLETVYVPHPDSVPVPLCSSSARTVQLWDPGNGGWWGIPSSPGSGQHCSLVPCIGSLAQVQRKVPQDLLEDSHERPRQTKNVSLPTCFPPSLPNPPSLPPSLPSLPTPVLLLRLTLAVLRVPYIVLGIKVGSATCKAKLVFSVQAPRLHTMCLHVVLAAFCILDY